MAGTTVPPSHGGSSVAERRFDSPDTRVRFPFPVLKEKMPKIEKLLAYVIADKDEEDEGVPAMMARNGMMFPLMGADEERMKSLRAEAQMIANTKGKPVKLLRFTQLEVLDVIEPKTQGGVAELVDALDLGSSAPRGA